MKTYQTRGVASHAARKSGMHRNTAARYLKAGVGPTEIKRRRTKRGRTRPDPLAELWPDAVTWLTTSPEIDAKSLFEHLLGQHPELATTTSRALRTFQRRVAQWRVQHGPPKEVYFPQDRIPGEALQFDWTHANELGVTIAGAPFEHLLAHAVLPFSNCEWAIPCRSESALSLKAGVQAAFWTFGGVTQFVQTDHSSTATHQLKRGQAERGFNTEYLALCAHLGVEPRTINIRRPNENGDVETAQGHLKRRLKNRLILRASHDFKTESDYAAFVARVCAELNSTLRSAAFAEESKRLRHLPATRFPEAEEVSARVSHFSTVRVKNHAYSVPSRLIGTWVQAYVTETEVTIHHAQQLVVRHPRAQGQEPKIDYRHIIASLVKKPGAFRTCVYREQLFPTLVFRQAHARLQAIEERLADKRYVQLLALAADQGEDRVGEAIAACLRDAEAPLPAKVRARLKTEPEPATALSPFVPQLSGYDRLLEVSA